MVVVPTVRESDGLALSSRNIYLDDESRARLTRTADGNLFANHRAVHF